MTQAMSPRRVSRTAPPTPAAPANRSRRQLTEQQERHISDIPRLAGDHDVLPRSLRPVLWADNLVREALGEEWAWITPLSHHRGDPKGLPRQSAKRPPSRPGRGTPPTSRNPPTAHTTSTEQSATPSRSPS